MKRNIIAVIGALAAVAILITILAFSSEKNNTEPSLTYHVNQGFVFGTYYNIRYEAPADLQDTIEACLRHFDFSLSTFNPNSTISLINLNKSDLTDDLFENMYRVAERVSEWSDGAFDITVAPLVNLWGFGFKNRQEATQERIDSIMPLVGYKKISLNDHHLLKQDKRILLDASAVAKGYSCDVVADLLRSLGCNNYLVDIGGEVVCRGLNDRHQPWGIGITKPVDDTTGQQTDIQAIVRSTALCMATSGNYRQFYYDNGIRRSHTINPRTGYPVNHSLLSATIIAPSCAQADALATACMVLGDQKALQLIDKIDNTECYLIVFDSISQQNIVRQSKGMAHYLKK